MNYSQTIALLLWLGFITLSQGRPATDVKANSKGSHETIKKSLHNKHHKTNPYHGKSNKRHLRKKKQFIMGGFGAGLAAAAGYPGYGAPGYPGYAAAGYPGVPDYSALSAQSNNQPYAGYAPSSANTDPYGLAALGAGSQSSLLSSSLTPTTSDLQSRQNMLSSYAGTADQSLGSYNGNGLSSYSNAGLQDTSALSNSMASLGYADQNGLSNSLSNAMAAGLSNSLGNSLGNSLSNGINSYTGSDASQMSGLNGYNSLSSSVSQAASDMSNPGGKYAASSLSSGLDSPNGIANIANLLNSPQASFDTDSQQGQVVGNSQDLNKLGQRFGNQGPSSQQTFGMPTLGQQQSNDATAEAQSFENQLSHMSNEKLKLMGNNHASYGNYGDNFEPNNLNEIGQIASTSISDSSLQKILGQLMAGQFGHGNHMSSSQSTAGLTMPSDSSMGNFETGNSEGMGPPQSDQLDDQQQGTGFSGPLVAPVIHGQTIHVHASDKPRLHLSDKGHASASKTAFNVQKQARAEHHLKLMQLKERLKMLREKLRKLKMEYNDNDDGDIDGADDETDNDFTSDLSEKSEMETLNHLKSATEQALKELKREMAKVKGKENEADLSHKLPAKPSSNEIGNKKGDTIGELEAEMLELINDDHQILNSRLNHRKPKHHAEKHLSLKELDKQAEQEVDYLTSRNPKVVRKKHHPRTHNSIKYAQNTGLHINIPEPVDEVDEAEVHPQIRKQPNLHHEIYRKQRPRVKPVKFTERTNHKPKLPSEGLGGIEKLLTRKHDGPGLNKTARAKHSLGFFSIGCWRDQPERALTSLEGIFPILDGNDYMRRKYAIRKCAQVARVQGFAAFAIENGGHCLGGKNVLQTYSMYGPSRGCKTNGRGGPWSMEVYKFTATSINPKNRRRGDILRAIDPNDVKNIFYKGK